MNDIMVVKLNHVGEEVFRYPGRVLARTPEYVQVEAFFRWDRVEVKEMVLLKGDRFIETYYTDRWYNIFEIHDPHTDALKGYYCNVGAPAVIENGEVSYRDLALDLLVLPDGRQQVLDEDEFEALTLSQLEKQQAILALAALQAHFEKLGI